MNRLLHHAASLAGLAVVAWIGAGYVVGHPLALALTALIAVFYAMGVVELHRYHQATAALGAAVDALGDAATAPALAAWLEPLPASLRHAVRLRVEGERVPLPGPALTPYLAGLLVLLGMLGTFLGMIVTLHGTGAALESATDLTAVRESLVAPVKGLGLAFGTSVAGVAASAALGLMSALCRRERLQVAQRLDARIGTTLRVHSGAHQREQALKALQRQSELVPQLVDRMQALMERLAQQSEEAGARLQARQDEFHGRTEQAHAALAASVDRSLKDSLAEAARVAAGTIQPVVEATMAGIARETGALHQALTDTLQRQLQQTSEGFERSHARLADTWSASLADQQRLGRDLSAEMKGAIDSLAATLDQRASGWLSSLAERQAEAQQAQAAAMASLSRDTASQLQAVGARLEDTAAGFASHAAALLDAARQANAELQAAAAARDDARLAAFAETLARHEAASEQAASATRDALDAAARGLEARTTAMAASMREAHQALQAASEARDDAHRAAWSQGLQAMAASLRDEWRQAGAQTLAQQQQVCETLSRTAQDITAQAESHARQTIAEITRLVQAASEAPRAAAEVIGELRQQLSAGMARDNEVLEERARLLATIDTLLDGVNRAATEQRGAIDALVGSSSELMARVGGQFAEQLERVGARFQDDLQAGTGRLSEVAVQLTGSAVEVASLGESMGAAVQQFGDASAQLSAQMQAIEAALSKSMARSDEQLAYYVAQAREVIDLSLLSQKRLMDDLHQLAGRSSASPSAATAAADA